MCMWQGFCACAVGRLHSVDPCGSGQSGGAALYLHPGHQQLPAAPGLCHFPLGLLLEEDQ